ncbi:adenylate kinase family protein [Candidatus Neptunochlamydia vexilliferae]|uniref:Adenylate kinase n=1 Tax=Candidatus Neptunichlamydia vexilliferae TaxID=1651774 RepID=A0ABS0AZS3_9BACT|nr:nucleoside monophosphate kinase [Candidatus Neptunochlamydia vexilliferae]MBF5059626.1 adenylate kinase [Candidatus Neptunochlamydia vexilliferae]
MRNDLTMCSQVDEKFQAVLIFGPPGSGKGTQGKFLSSAGNHFHLSSGDVFRGLSPESPAGKLYHSYAGKGELLPDNVTVEIWHHYVMGLIATNQYFPKEQLLLLDGIPRTVKQAEILERYTVIKKIILLEAKDSNVLVQRLKRRALIEKRHDDRDEGVLKKRMEIYEKETFPLLEHYDEKLIARFNAELRPLEVLRDILVSLCDLLS